MRDMDADNLGHLSNEKVYKVMVEQMKLQQEVFSLKWMAMVFVMVVALLSVSARDLLRRRLPKTPMSSMAPS
jgi:hypothetical protein